MLGGLGRGPEDTPTRASGHSHSHRPSPTADASAWADFILASPGRWSSAVSGLHFVDSCCDAAAVAKVSTVGGTRPHACTICDGRFASAKALSQHMRMQHGRKGAGDHSPHLRHRF